MDNRENISQDEHGNGRVEVIDLLSSAKDLMLRRFDWMTEGSADAILRLCLKNSGLLMIPLENPLALIGYYRFWPRLLEAVEEQDFVTLGGENLTQGPILYVAAFICPARGYEILRDILRILNPYALSFHRLNKRTGQFRFNCLRYRGFRKEVHG